jgi:hypothetical protein
MTTLDQNANSPEPTKAVGREISGKWVIVGLFTFAILITATLWIYWKLHVGPFLPLQQALADKFEDSRPRVEGGQRKAHKGTLKILRITMKIEFDPTKNRMQADDFAAEVFQFIKIVSDLETYQQLELHLYFPHPEEKIIEQTFHLDL